MVQDYPLVVNKAKADAQPRPNADATTEPPKRIQFYALKVRKEKEKSADVVTNTLHVFTFPVYAL